MVHPLKRLESTAIVLQVTNLQERDRIVSFVSPGYGLKRGVAQGARTKFSRFQGALHSLAEVEIRWLEKPGRDLVRISEVSLVRGSAHHSTSLEQLMVGQYFAESIEKFTVEEESAALEYRLLRSCVTALYEGAPLKPLTRYFESWLLQVAGIFALAGECPGCGGALDAGAVLPDDSDALFCRRCSSEAGVSGKQYGPDSLAFLAACARSKPQDPPAAGPTTLRQVEDLTREVRRRFLGSELKSYEVMQRTLSEVGS